MNNIIELNALIASFELGYKAHERGQNWEQARDNFISFIKDNV
ncbi:MAG: hypothetical protein AABY22_32975 [Nanoarchaeota archaeon]